MNSNASEKVSYQDFAKSYFENLQNNKVKLNEEKMKHFSKLNNISDYLQFVTLMNLFF